MQKRKRALSTSADAKIIGARLGNNAGTGKENGEDEAAAVDEGGRADAEDACAPEDKDNSDCAETWAERGSDLSEGMGDWCDAGGGEGRRGRNRIALRRRWASDCRVETQTSSGQSLSPQARAQAPGRRARRGPQGYLSGVRPGFSRPADTARRGPRQGKDLRGDDTLHFPSPTQAAQD